MGKKRATIRDVARLSGFSTTAVSNALNNKNARIPEATREKIREAARRLHYTPNALIRAMHTGRTNVFGLYMVFPPVAVGQFFASLLFNLQEAAAAVSHDLLLHRRVDSTEEFDDAAQFLDGRIDGLFYWGAHQVDFIEGLVEREFPVVGLFSFIDKPGAGRVWCDETTGLREAFRRLTELGHQEIHVPPYLFESPAVQLRGRAVDELLKEFPLTARRGRLDGSAHGRVEWFNTLLNSPNPPTALIAGGTTQGYQALAAARRAGLRVPEDISIVCHEGVEAPGAFEIASVVTPLAELCRAAIDLMGDMIDGARDRSLEVVLPTTFSPGRTLGPPRKT